MFKIEFGLLWLLILSPLLIICVTSEDLRNDGYASLGIYLFVLIFLLIGLYMLITGIIEVIRNKKTNKFSVLTFGQIASIYKTGVIDNGDEEFAAEVLTYVPDLNKVVRVTESLGFSVPECKVEDFVQLKFCNGDINILQVVSENTISNTILRLIKEEKMKEYTVIINGEEYTKRSS